MTCLQVPLRYLRAMFAGCVASCALTPLFAQTTPVYEWTTLAGRALVGDEDGVASAARFNQPHGIVRAADGTFYVADTGNHTIRAISPAGTVSTFAGASGQFGSADGVGTAARFNRPHGLAIDATGNLYVADTGNATIRRVTPAGVVTTIAGAPAARGNIDGPAAAARFTEPTHIVVDSTGNNAYVIDQGIGVRRLALGTVDTVLREGALLPLGGQNFQVDVRTGLAIDASGSVIVSARLRLGSWFRMWLLRIDGSAASPYRHIGELVGQLDSAGMDVDAIAFRPDGDVIVAVYGYPQVTVSVWRFAPGSTTAVQIGKVQSSSGNFDHPNAFTIAPDNSVYFTRWTDDAIVQLSNGVSTVLAGTPWSNIGVDGNGAGARFSGGNDIVVEKNGTSWVADEFPVGLVVRSANLRRIDSNGSVSTPFGEPILGRAETIEELAVDSAGTVYFTFRNPHHYLARRTSGGQLEFQPWPPQPKFMKYVATGPEQLFGISPELPFSQRIFAWSVTDKNWFSLTGGDGVRERVEGSFAEARFGTTAAITADSHGNIYVVDVILTHGGGVTDAKVRKLVPGGAGAVSTITGDVKVAALSDPVPRAIAVDATGRIFLAYVDHTVRIVVADGEPRIIGGTSEVSGSRDGRGGNARFFVPQAIGVDSEHRLYVLDAEGTTVRRGTVVGDGPIIRTQPQSQSVVAGTTAQFAVEAAGLPAPTYQWLFNDNPIAGATGNTLSVSSVTTANAGNYSVVVTNQHGTATSNRATLTVTVTTPPPVQPPSGGNGGGGGGGGGAPSVWLLAALGILAAFRRWAGAIPRQCRGDNGGLPHHIVGTSNARLDFWVRFMALRTAFGTTEVKPQSKGAPVSGG